jgi:hypothetical protein
MRLVGLSAGVRNSMLDHEVPTGAGPDAPEQAPDTIALSSLICRFR